MITIQSLKWEGVMPAVTAQFNASGELDLEAFSQNLAFQKEAGVHGFILGGTLGEASTLRSEEKKQLLQKAKLIAKNDIPVIINIAEQSNQDAISAVALAEKNEADGLMLLPPMRYKATDQETVAYFEAIAQKTSVR